MTDPSNTNEETNTQTTFTCAICLEGAKLPVVTHCGHVYCWACLKDWFARSPQRTCPTCLAQLRHEDVIKVYNSAEKEPVVDDRPEPRRRTHTREDRAGFADFGTVSFQFGFGALPLMNVFSFAERREPSSEQERELRKKLMLVFFLMALFTLFRLLFL